MEETFQILVPGRGQERNPWWWWWWCR